MSDIDIGRITEALNGKMDRDATNRSDVGSGVMAHMAMPSNKYIDLTLGASGTSYIAPADGYYFARGNWASSGSLFYLAFDVVGKSFGTMTQTGHLGPTFGKVICPVSKGDVVTLSYNLITITDFRFIYAIGSESEAS